MRVLNARTGGRVERLPRTWAGSPLSVVPRKRPGYAAGMHELFEHTADLGLRAEAATSRSCSPKPPRACSRPSSRTRRACGRRIVQTIEIAGTDREYLLFDWLKELLSRFDDGPMLFAGSR